ncbi:hypothetical protein CBS101457_001830 [Exobasidium rhododendri]|nr:hypothetical protein CBS101457_001830 [Exobasidium rhododendri]
MASSSSSRASSSLSPRRRRSSSTNESQVREGEYVYALPDTTISEWLKCAICLSPFVEPVQGSTCEHIFCKECISLHLSSASSTEYDLSSEGNCPTCRSPMSVQRLRPCALLIRNMVDSLLVKCPHERRGCPHVCERSLVDLHARKDCGWAWIGEIEMGTDLGRSTKGRCECGKKLLRKDWEAHLSNGECSIKRLRCRYADDENGCQRLVKEGEVEDHLARCPASPLVCPYCSLALRRKDMEVHEVDCPNVIVGCTLLRFGCSWEGKRCHLNDAHLSQCHYAPLEAYLVKQELEVTALRRENAQMGESILKMEQEQKQLALNLRRHMSSLGSNYVQSVHGQIPGGVQTDSTVAAFSSPSSLSRSTYPAPQSSPWGRLDPVPFISEMSISGDGQASVQLASTSAPVSHADFPWLWPESGTHSSTRQTDQQHSRSLSDSIIDLNERVATIFDQIGQLDRKIEDGHVVSCNTAFEASRAHEELNNVRHGLHALRISLLMQQQRSMPGNSVMKPHSILDQQYKDSNSNSNSTTASSAMPFIAGPHPSMMGLRRFWTGHEQTKL